MIARIAWVFVLGVALLIAFDFLNAPPVPPGPQPAPSANASAPGEITAG